LWTKKEAKNEGAALPPEGPAQSPGNLEIDCSGKGAAALPVVT